MTCVDQFNSGRHLAFLRLDQSLEQLIPVKFHQVDQALVYPLTFLKKDGGSMYSI